jgi:hypothetical protein
MKPSEQRLSDARRQHIEAIVARHVRPSSSPQDLFDRRRECGPLAIRIQ